MDLKIYIEQLKEGKKEIFQGKVSSDFMPKEEDLFFEKEITVSGEAYIAGDHLILKLDAKVKAYLPCSICNEPTEVSLILSDFYQAEPLEQITSSPFDFSEILRTDLLLQLPPFVECKGNCPERTTMKKFLKEEDCNKTHCQFPFAGL